MLYPHSLAVCNLDFQEENEPKHFARTETTCKDSKGISFFPAIKVGSTQI